jgi:hypothetical protein
MSAAVDFLAALMDGTHPHSLCAKAKGGKFYTVGHYTDPESLLAAAAAATARGEDVWFGVHALHGLVDGRDTENDVALVRCLVADLDWYDPDAHADKELPDETTVRNIVASNTSRRTSSTPATAYRATGPSPVSSHENAATS